MNNNKNIVANALIKDSEEKIIEDVIKE